MRTLYLHVGAGKTGTSALQSFFDGNREWLASKGVDYPPGPQRPDPATGISSGNGGWLARYAQTGRPEHWGAFADQLQQAREDCDILVSSELLAGTPQARITDIAARLEQLGFAIRACYLVRNPDEWYMSAYQQRVKRHGYWDEFAAFCRSNPLEFEVALRNYDGALGEGSLRLLSYEAGRERIVEYCLTQALGIHEPPPLGPNVTINRSLTQFELAVLRAQNAGMQALGLPPGPAAERSTAVSDLLVALRPDVQRDVKYREPLPADIVDRLTPFVDRVNARLAEGHIRFAVTDRTPPLASSELEAVHMFAAVLVLQGRMEVAEQPPGDVAAGANGQPEGEAAPTVAEQALAAEISALRSSTSWRMTAPLRAVTDRLRNPGPANG